MGKTLKKLFDFALPFSGDKTKLAAWILGLGALKDMVPSEAIDALIAALSSGPLNYGALALLVVGIVHKQLKKKYGKTP